MKIYERLYDNPTQENGDAKPNKFLGDFKILETIDEDGYTSTRIGTKGKEDTVYLIQQFEISGRFTGNGGSKFEVSELKTLKPR